MFAIIDVETTGGKPPLDRITEIAVLIHNGKRVIESFSTLINPGRKIDPFVVGLTGINDEMVENAPTFEQIAPRIEEMTQGRVFVAHNVRFDYGIIRREFQRIGKNFHRKQLDTIKLAQKIFPGQQSYSLGRLCRALNIPVDNRHRALGDTEATAALFEKLVFNDRKEIIQSELNEGIEDNLLPPLIKREAIELLPEETGVYYFKDEKGKILYIGKSTNIRKRVLSHFSSDLKEERFAELKAKLAHVDFELTGNELVALLLESDEIKRWMPAFNRAQKRKKYRYGLFLRENEHGYLVLRTDLLNMSEEPLTKFATELAAQRVLQSLNDRYFTNYTDAFWHRLKEEGKEEEFRKKHDKIIQRIKHEYLFLYPNFFVIGPAVNPEEKSLIWVEQNQFKGIGNHLMNGKKQDVEELKASIKSYQDSPDLRKIIKTYLAKHPKKLTVLTY